jgi:hypothetical protein
MRNDSQQRTARRLSRRISNTNSSVHRACGYLTDFSIKRPYRNARVCRIYEGAKDIQPLVILRLVRGSSSYSIYKSKIGWYTPICIVGRAQMAETEIDLSPFGNT